MSVKLNLQVRNAFAGRKSSKVVQKNFPTDFDNDKESTSLWLKERLYVFMTGKIRAPLTRYIVGDYMTKRDSAFQVL